MSPQTTNRPTAPEIDVSIVIACYNESELLEESVRELVEMFRQTIYSYELIFVDDNSRDNTVEIIKRICGRQDNCCFIPHEINCGRGKTVCDGLVVANGKYVGFIDIDLEVHCRYIPAMILALEHGADVALAQRDYRTSVRPLFLLRYSLSVGYRNLLKLVTKIQTGDTESGFKFFKREKVLPLLQHCKFAGWFWDTEIIYLCERVGLKIDEIHCLFLRRADKVSKLKIFQDTWQYIKDLYHLRFVYKYDIGNSDQSPEPR